MELQQNCDKTVSSLLMMVLNTGLVILYFVSQPDLLTSKKSRTVFQVGFLLGWIAYLLLHMVTGPVFSQAMGYLLNGSQAGMVTTKF